MKKIKILSLILAASFPLAALASSSLTLSPPGGAIKAGDTFKITIFADPNGASLDTVRARINFSNDLLEIKDFSLNSSFSFQSGGNDLGNQTGQFTWGSGVAGGISQSSSFGTITFKAKKEGQAVISVSPDSLVLSAGENSFDGKTSSAVYRVSPALTDPPAQAPNNTAPKKPEPKVATSTPAPDSFLGQTEEKESLFPSQTADLSSNILPFVEDSSAGEQPLFSRANKIILGAMVLILFLIGGAIYRLKDKEVRI